MKARPCSVVAANNLCPAMNWVFGVSLSYRGGAVQATGLDGDESLGEGGQVYAGPCIALPAIFTTACSIVEMGSSAGNR